jgi:enoyl-CoA hydratase/carnithine racemase
MLEALDRAMEIAKHLAKHESRSVASIKRLVRNATAMPLAEGLALERNLFLKLAISDSALERMREYDAQKDPTPAQSMVLKRYA